MSTRATSTVCALLLGAVLAGCGGTSPGTPSTTVAAGPSDAEIARHLSEYLEEDYGPHGPLGETYWWHFITEIQVVGGDIADIRTSLYDDADAKLPAQAICLSTLGTDFGIHFVRVTDPSGVSIAKCG